MTQELKNYIPSLLNSKVYYLEQFVIINEILKKVNLNITAEKEPTILDLYKRKAIEF